MLLPSSASTLVQYSVSRPLLSNLYNQTSVLLIFCASMSITWFATGEVIVNSPESNVPCRRCTKNPVFTLLGPAPSFLYMMPKLLPITGKSSIILPSCISAETISKGCPVPCILFLKEYFGKSVLTALNLYCSLGILFTRWFLIGLPNTLLTGCAALNIFINCSYQLVFVGSFHTIDCPASPKPFESTIFSEVRMLVTFNSPLAGKFRFGL